MPHLSFGQDDLDSAIGKLADKISQSMTEKKKTKIAVVPFQDLSSDTVTTFGKYIAEELTTALFGSGKFNIVERNLLTKVLDELKLSKTGSVDPNSAKELGKITGVDAVVTGTIQDLVDRVAVNCRIIETETGNIFAAASEKITKNEAITKMLSGIAGSSTTPPQPDTTSAQTKAAKYDFVIEKDDFNFELWQCKLSGTTLTCYLIITNNGADRELYLYGNAMGVGSRIVDQFGNEVWAKSAGLGNQAYYGYAQSRLISGIPLKGSVRFENVSSNLTLLAVLEINCGGNTKVQFRNVPIKGTLTRYGRIEKDENNR
jgi:TolB-like protein